jgi:general secretion pathway protein I
MKGFTLLEVIIALIIAGMAAAALFEAVGSGLHQTQTASMYDQAIVRAKSRLAAAVHGTKLEPGDRRGDDGGGFRWRLRVAPTATASVRPVGLAGPRAAASFPVVLYGVTVWIGWNDGDTEREVRLDTEQVGGG